MRAMLLSSSRVENLGFLEHVRHAISQHLQSEKRLVFVPYALADHDTYVAKVQQALNGICAVRGAHQLSESDIATAPAIFVGGGNTFRLLKTIQDLGLQSAIEYCVRNGAPYIGSSAGTNLACPTIRTTNDMPIVEPKTFDALGIVPFQINPHFVEGGIAPSHNGETREQRIIEYLEENKGPVVALREPARLVLDDDSLALKGGGGVLFENDRPPSELSAGDDLSHLLST